MMDLANDKATLRSRLLNARQRMTRTRRDRAITTLRAAILAMSEASQARVIAAYVSFGAEPDTRETLEAWRERGIEILLPVLLADADLDWARYDGPHFLTPNARGLLEPSGPRLGRSAIAGADLVLAPALAVDAATGVRLGRGGGSYDRALARVPAGRPIVTMLYDGEVLDGVPAAAHDRPVDIALTPSQTYRFEPRALPR